MTTSTLAKKLEAILASGLTYKAVAERAGCDTSTIFRIKNGSVANPSYSVGIAIDELHAGLLKKSAAKRPAA